MAAVDVFGQAADVLHGGDLAVAGTVTPAGGVAAAVTFVPVAARDPEIVLGTTHARSPGAIRVGLRVAQVPTRPARGDAAVVAGVPYVVRDVEGGRFDPEWVVDLDPA